MTKSAFVAILLALASPVPAAAAGDAPPSRAPNKGCAWEHLSDAAVGLSVWTQGCDYGFRKITMSLQPQGLFQRYSDGGDPELLVEVHRLRDGESMADGMRRVWATNVSPELQKRCVRVAYREGKIPPGVQRYAFAPDAAFAKQLAAVDTSGDIPEPPCGDHGVAVDSIQYFETRPDDHARAFLFVNAGQDDPLFDDRNLHLIGTAASPTAKPSDATR
jgi:hypothetical protein